MATARNLLLLKPLDNIIVERPDAGIHRKGTLKWEKVHFVFFKRMEELSK